LAGGSVDEVLHVARGQRYPPRSVSAV
jgi:hypothetical protein